LKIQDSPENWRGDGSQVNTSVARCGIGVDLGLADCPARPTGL
jgi:hypothetical protein